MKRTFFEQIGIADMERIHTQILQWIFSSECTALDKIQKLALIKALFDLKATNIISVYTEYHNLDLVIHTPEHIICLENKFKSSQHSHQLEKYSSYMETQYPPDLLKFYFLTLAEEKAFGDKWKNISYRNLLDHLSAQQLQNHTDFHRMLYNEYLSTLKNIVTTAEDFVQNPSSYKNVFSDGSKKKSQKIRSVDYSRTELISANQLETIFQQLYFRKVMDIVGLEKQYFITETRGNAILGITIKSNVLVANRKGVEAFNFSMQFQFGTFKIFCVPVDYHISHKDDMPDEIKIAFSNISECPDLFYIKSPNHGKTRAQCSVTKRIEGWGTFSIEKFAKIFMQELEIARRAIETVIIPRLKIQIAEAE